MARVLAAVTLALGLAGCADPAAQTYRVTGTISWNGKPIEAGRINFVDPAGQSTPASAKIANGRFDLRTTRGVKTVMVYNQRDNGFNKAMNQHTYTNEVPAEFNSQSKLTFEVMPHDENVYDASLQPPAK